MSTLIQTNWFAHIYDDFVQKIKKYILIRWISCCLLIRWISSESAVLIRESAINSFPIFWIESVTDKTQWWRQSNIQNQNFVFYFLCLGTNVDDLYNTGITATEQPCVSNFINCQFYMNHLNGILLISDYQLLTIWILIQLLKLNLRQQLNLKNTTGIWIINQFKSCWFIIAE